MKTIAQQLNVKTFPFRIKDNNNNEIYYELPCVIWYKCEFDDNNNEIYYETSEGFWSKREFDDNNNEIYYENSNGDITNKRTTELTMDEIAKKFNINVNQLKVIK